MSRLPTSTQDVSLPNENLSSTNSSSSALNTDLPMVDSSAFPNKYDLIKMRNRNKPLLDLQRVQTQSNQHPQNCSTSLSSSESSTYEPIQTNAEKTVPLKVSTQLSLNPYESEKRAGLFICENAPNIPILKQNDSSMAGNSSVPVTSSQVSSTVRPKATKRRNNARNAAKPLLRKNGIKCCDKKSMRYNTPNLPCDGEYDCKIKQSHSYWMEKDGSRFQYCTNCSKKRFTKNDLEEKFDKKKNVGIEEESVYECIQCKGGFHRMCSYFFDEDPSEYCCHECREPEVIKNVDSFSKNEIDSFISEKVNKKLMDILGNQEKADSCKISVCNVHNAESSRRYGDKLDYTERTFMAFQRNGDTDILFFVMYVQEYIMEDGVGWLVLDYLDTVPHVEPVDKKGVIYQTIILSYWEHMVSHGFTRGHFWAKPPAKEDDYIFHIHPKDQHFLNQAKLEKWYKKLLKTGCDDGIVNHFRLFEEEQKAGTMKKLIDLPVFKESLWPLMFNWAESDVDHKVEKNFETAMEKYKRQHQKDNFYIYFKQSGPSVAIRPEVPILKMPLFGSRSEFNAMCDEKN
uniref:histone acetyltransferase n=1 Tax=Caenorhabditis tropicalis TaxID=1561998 RepID=A0A1I7TLE4_9PELO